LVEIKVPPIIPKSLRDAIKVIDAGIDSTKPELINFVKKPATTACKNI